MYLESPICYPTAKLLDWLLGSHTTHLYRREELKTLVHLHGKGRVLGDGEGELVAGVLGLAERTVSEVAKRTRELYAASDGVRICDVDLKQVRLRSRVNSLDVPPDRVVEPLVLGPHSPSSDISTSYSFDEQRPPLA